MTAYTYPELVGFAQADGTALSSFTTAASLLPAPARYTTPASGFWSVGKVLMVKGAGRISNVVTAQPTFTLQVQAGPSSNITVFSGGAMTCSTTAHTNVPFTFEIMLTCRAIGSGTSANLMGQGWIQSQAFVVSGATADSANTHTTLLIPNTAPAVGTGFDSTVSSIIDLYMACGTSNASNAVTLHQYQLIALN